MVFDTMAWGVTLIVGVILGICYERARHLSRLLYDSSILKNFKDKYIKDDEPKRKDSEKVM